jgi:hypothetical protein
VEKSGGGKVWVGERGGSPKLERVLMEGVCGSLLARNDIMFPIILDLFCVLWFGKWYCFISCGAYGSRGMRDFSRIPKEA